MANQTEICNWIASTQYLVNDIVTVAGAFWRRIANGTSGSSWDLDEKHAWEKLAPDETVTAITVYLDGTDGSDADSGSVNAPVKTMAGAYARIPDRVLHPALVRIVDAVDPYIAAKFEKDLVRAPVGLTGIDVLTEVLGTTSAITGTNATKIVTAGGLTANAYRGLWLQITGGAGTGVLVQVSWNDATTLYPSTVIGTYDASLVPNNTSVFRIVRPSVEITLPDAFAAAPLIMADGMGSGASGTVPGSEDDAILHVSLIVLKPASGASVAGLGIRSSRLCFWGVEIESTLIDAAGDSQLLAGTDATPISGGAVGPYELGLTSSKDAWRGAGFLSAQNSIAGSILLDVSRFWGFACFGEPQVFNGDEVVWMGGSVVADADTAITVDRGFARIGDALSASTKVQVFVENATARTHRGILCQGGGRLELLYVRVRFGGTPTNGVGIFAIAEGHSLWSGPGHIAIGDNVAVDGGPDILCAAANGGHVDSREGLQHDASPITADFAILPVQVTDAPSATITQQAFVPGATIIDAARFTIIRRGS